MKSKRTKMDITLHEMSKKTKVSISFLSQIENCKANCPEYLTKKIAKMLLCEPDTLFRTGKESRAYRVAKKGR